MRKTFDNLRGDSVQLKEAKDALYSVQKDLEMYEEFGDLETEEDKISTICDSWYDSLDDIIEKTIHIRDLPPFNHYGLSFDFVELGSFEDQDEPYFRYQIAYGGPTHEIRFYETGLIEFVWLHWFVGIGFDISNESWAKWLHDYFEDIGMLNWEDKSND